MADTETEDLDELIDVCKAKITLWEKDEADRLKTIADCEESIKTLKSEKTKWDGEKVKEEERKIRRAKDSQRYLYDRQIEIEQEKIVAYKKKLAE